jgi:hypothetical protein
MQEKWLGLAALGLSAASQAFIKHNDTAMFYSVVFFVIGLLAFIQGHAKDRK